MPLRGEALGTVYRAAALLTGIAVLAAACSPGAAPSVPATPAPLDSSYQPEKGVPGGQLTYAHWQPVMDLNVLTSPAVSTQQVALGPVWASLWVFGPDNLPIPDLVQEVPTAENGGVRKIDDQRMDVTLRLRKGLRWSDGSPLTTEDVKFTIEAICDPATGAISRAGFDHIASIEIRNPSEMVWHFGPNKKGTCGLSGDLESGVFAAYLLLTTPVLPRSVLGRVTHPEWATHPYFTRRPTVTSGPYRVESFTPGAASMVVLIPNLYYADGREGGRFFGHRPYLSRLVYKTYGDRPSLIGGLEAGDTDLALGLVPRDLPALEAIRELRTESATGLVDEFLNFNLGRNTAGCVAPGSPADCGTPTIFKGDKPLRQAIDLAVDKEALNQQAVEGAGRTMNSPFVSALRPYVDPGIPAFHRDVERANRLLDQDGWARGPDGIRSKNGRKLAWVLSAAASAARVAEEDLLINNWRDIGATVTIKNYPSGLFFAEFNAGGINATGQFDMSLYGNRWAPDPHAWAQTVLRSQVPTAANPLGQNWNRVDDPELDRLFAEGASTVELSKRVQLYRQAQREWRDYTPTISLYERPDIFSHAVFFGNLLAGATSCLAVCNAADWYRRSAP